MRRYKIVSGTVNAVETHRRVANGDWALACDDKTLQPYIWDKSTYTRWPASVEFIEWQDMIYRHYLTYWRDIVIQQWKDYCEI